MEKRNNYQFGEKSLYIEKNEGNVYLSDYKEEPVSAFKNGSFELYDYTPTISPVISRSEVGFLQSWIESDAIVDDNSARLALLYGKAGIGKSVVMHNLLLKLQANNNYLVLGLKSDQVEFINTEDLKNKLHLPQPIEIVVKKMAQQYKRVILLIDQIDALSLSLSSNRTPLRSLLKLIEQIKHIPHVRIVISCRPYDLEYDPLLDRLHIKNKWELHGFTKEQVIHILQENHCEDRMNDTLLQFLGNPLHLYLFLKIKPDEQHRDPLTMDLLYHQLWAKYVTDDSERKVDKSRLLSLLDALVTAMYKRQELSVHIREFETEYSSELKYLFTQGLLLITKNRQVQFFHQTLFDYVYARRFTERGNNLLEELKAQHQGLFSRAAVKSILSYLRELNPTEYIKIIDQLLYSNNSDGKDTYRYHLKSLALNNMAYFEIPLEEEINLIRRKIFKNKTYMNVLFESIHTAKWFKAIWNIINHKGGWKSLSPAYQEKTMLMCQRTLWTKTEIVLEQVDQSLDYNNEEDCRYIGILLQSYDLNCKSQILIKLYNKFFKNRYPLPYHLLSNIMKDNPAFVCQELKEKVKFQLKKKDKSGIHLVSINYKEETLYQDLLKSHHDYGIQLLTDILFLIYNFTQYKIEGSEFFSSFEFFSFQRKTDGDLSSNFTETLLNIIIDDFLKSMDDTRTRRYIADFHRSKYECFVFMALYIYTSNKALFKNELCDMILNRSVLSNAPSWVEYQAIEALKVTFPLWNDTQKSAVIERILTIQDRGEKILLSKDIQQNRLKYGHPLLDIDLHKGKALEVIPIDELRKFSWTSYQERLRIDRKFNNQRLKNEKPSSFSSKWGDPSLTQEQGSKMSCKTWFHSMQKYDNNDPFDWDKPSLTGQCQLFRSVVSNNPDKYISLIDKTILCEHISLLYPQAGMQGLLDAGKIPEADHVLQRILEVVNNDVNSTIREFSIHSLLFALSDFIKSGNVTESVIKLLCNALINAKEPEEDSHLCERDIYSVGINQARGHAGYMLVGCAKDETYKEEIFVTLEHVAKKASVYTRAAILLNMASLNSLDKNRNVKLFKKLMYDYDARLMSMPVNDYNPLVYFVNYALDELMDFFRHATECPSCYAEQVIILWLAWSHNKNNEEHDCIKELLDKMCISSEEARISLLKFLCTLKENVSEETVEYILSFMDAAFDSPKMGEACDHIFHHIDSWPDDIQTKIAEKYVNSLLSKYQVKTFIKYLAGYAIKDPVQALTWLEKILNSPNLDDNYIWNHILDVIIQSYNGIKSFNDNSYQKMLEQAMDLIDSIIQDPDKKYLISNFINKLDNE